MGCNEQDIPHNLLNAKPENVERESEIIVRQACRCCYYCDEYGRTCTDIILVGIVLMVIYYVSFFALAS